MMNDIMTPPTIEETIDAYRIILRSICLRANPNELENALEGVAAINRDLTKNVHDYFEAKKLEGMLKDFLQ